MAYISWEFVRKAKERYWYDIFITEWLRTKERQQELYAQGRTKPWKIVTYIDWVNQISDHQLWNAIDIAFRGSVLYPKDNIVWDNLATLAWELGMKSWWKEWKWDKPHFWIDDIETSAIKAGKKYWVNWDFLYCLSVAETSAGKNIKSSNNVVNAWNHDSWVVKEFDSIKDNFDYIADKLVNWKYLSQRNKVAELSCGGRIKILWRKSCKRTENDYYYASDMDNRHVNMQRCLEKRLWSWDYLNWNYKN